MLATVYLLKEFRLNLLGFPVGPLGLSRDLTADPPCAAGERIAAGVHLHLQAVTALADHGGILGLVSPLSLQKNDCETAGGSVMMPGWSWWLRV
jgi:hypothetical protein